jgi:hypothetical protein
VPKTYAESIKEFQELTASTDANAGELPELEIQRQALKEVLEEVLSLITEQALHRANKQQASTRLQALMDKGTVLATSMKVVIRQHYGSRSDKLAEFGLLPFRGRRRKVEATPPPEDPGTPPKVEPAKPDPSSKSAE